MLERRVKLIVRSLLVAIVVLSAAARSSEADFTTIINVPPDTMPASIGSHTQVNVFDGGMLFDGFEAGAADGSSEDIEVNLFGGSLTPIIQTLLTAYPGSVINMYGPFEEGSGIVHTRVDGGRLNMVNGLMHSMSASNSAEVNISGGTISNMGAVGGSTVNQAGGAIVSDLNLLSGEGTVWNLYDGEIGNRFEMREGAKMNMYGGQIGYRFSVGDGTTMNIFGGTISLGPDTSRDYAFMAESGSTVNVHGGLFRENVFVGDGTHFNLFVQELSLDGVPVPLVLGEQTVIPNTGGVLLEAILADGTFLDLGLGRGSPGFDHFDDGAILTATLVPEPSTWVLAILAAVGLIGLRSRHRNGK
ncbi:MAG: PEP-CTERM sorting domain-containing protein [Pirellulales bacterium]